jgi:hypothetical protein
MTSGGSPQTQPIRLGDPRGLGKWLLGSAASGGVNESGGGTTACDSLMIPSAMAQLTEAQQLGQLRPTTAACRRRPYVQPPAHQRLPGGMRPRLCRNIHASWPSRAMDVSLDLNQRIDSHFRNEQVLPVHFQHHEPFLVKGEQSPPLGLCLSTSIGVHDEVCSAKHDHPLHWIRSWCDHSPHLLHRVSLVGRRVNVCVRAPYPTVRRRSTLAAVGPHSRSR